MFQAPAFAKNQVTHPFRKTAAEASPFFQIRSNYSPLSDSDGGESNFYA